MLAQQLLPGLLVVALGVNVVLALWLYRLGRRLPEDGSSGTGAVDHESGTVECPTCGAENELGYRYCGSCIGELPASRTFEETPNSPFRQVT